ncbi:hypothetical protein M3936_16285 [Sutcliffiella horikoshii]|uniref:hypothetical protein n=1 Tax=Sutcliffiella horikoshii TaxID=79883 RepID=UPI0020420180|nr:hypothetical protein [Sutcliffiella horikoshii]MCM3619148.1 hypothetical protein [Sutcliffiella horikoshii]
MSYPWYSIRTVEDSAQFSQGEILECKVPVTLPGSNPPYFQVKVGKIKGIIMTQACDLENAKVKVPEVTICPLTPAEAILQDFMMDKYKDKQGFDYQNLSRKEQESKYNYANKLRQGNILDYHLLNSFHSEDHPNLDMDLQVVTLRHVYRIPVESLRSQLIDNPTERLTLLPPYREHLANAFTVNFSRIGLPTDIEISRDI